MKQMLKRKNIPYKQLDRNIVKLVRALNAFEGISTIGSCGGHANQTNPSQWTEGSWYVKFYVAHDDEGWFALEFLAWLINNSMQRSDKHVSLYPTAPPPYLNSPGEVLAFVLEGEQEDSEEVARLINAARRKVYLGPS